MSVLPSTRLTKQPPTYSHPRQWHIIISPQTPCQRFQLAILTSAHNCRHPSSSSSSHKSGKRRRGIKTNNPIGRRRTAAFLFSGQNTREYYIYGHDHRGTMVDYGRWIASVFLFSVSSISSASRKRCPNVTKSHQRGFYRLAQFSIVGWNFSHFFLSFH